MASVALAAAGLAACQDETAKVVRPVPVRVETVSLEPLTSSRRYTGVVRPRYESALAFRVAGKIVERKVNVGDRVQADGIIAILDATDFKLALAAQDAELAAAKSSLAEATAALERYRILNRQGWAANAALDTRQASADEAQSRVDRALRNQEALSNQVAYTELRAGKDGIVSSFSAEAGQVVAAGQAIAQVARLDELEAVVAIPEQKLGELKTAEARVEIWPDKDKSYPATLREISPDADRAARTFDVRFSINAPGEEVRLGKTATVVLSARASRPVARVPLGAVMNDAKGPMVWVVAADGTRIERRAVTIEYFGQDKAVVGSGLASGERIVTLGVHTLDEKTPVRIVEQRAALSAPAKGADHGD